MSELDDDMAKDVRSRVPSTLLIFNHQYDAISGMILAMADVMEAAIEIDKWQDPLCHGEEYKHCDRCKSLKALRTNITAANKVIKEVTG